ncbi:S53 family peptidase [Nocardioides sp. GY 10127]|uniref:S53 family peptidase n=1 Tax=Nocardioides sp. GY 10127 TaxID=2569762 RepID=UPI0010A85A6B|nr:S53 family peptidase [Nocardioides sp. GY 10127]TIC78929.1 hypothetical protein E8D37_18815 [Nocardioides sp. GY 10127]
MHLRAPRSARAAHAARTARPGRLLALTTAAALAAAGLTAVASTPADAAGSTSTASGSGTQSVTVFLTSPDAEGLADLAATPLTGTHLARQRAARLAELAALVPSDADRAAVVSELEDRGYTVESETTWSVTATAPQTQVSDDFGDLDDSTGTGTGSAGGTSAGAAVAEQRAATTALPDVPHALDDLVSAAFLTTDTDQAVAPSTTTTLDGDDVRNADTPANVAAATGEEGAGLTVATLQFSDWDSSDLTAYAAEHDLEDPVAAGRYTEVDVDGGPSATDTTDDGSVEVALDQESILSTAPGASQQAYFAPNTDAGFGDAFAAVYDDVTGASTATSPDAGIAALSLSWGACESAWGTSSIDALEPVMESVVAAGVTIFAASGDNGIYDCGTYYGRTSSTADVEFPASSPAVVAVGGTNLSSDDATANDGTNWTETAWSCTSTYTCATTTGGSGGGASGSGYGASWTAGDFVGFAAPLWQTATLTGDYADADTRLVPDIAADADPNTGFVLYTSASTYTTAYGSNDLQVGGTSLASPLSAAQLVTTLGAAGFTAGVGDLHPALYSAYAKTRRKATTSSAKAFRDVTSGSNGAAADAGDDPSVTAASGYDTVTGLGGVLWSALVPYLDADAPTVTTALAAKKKTGARTRRLAVTWTATSTLTLASTTARLVRVTSSGTTPVRHWSTAAGAHTIALRTGRTYRLVVTSTDLGGATTTQRRVLRLTRG